MVRVQSTLPLTNLMDNLYESDFLAFALIILSAAKLKMTGIKVSVIVATIVEDSALYFLFVLGLGSHL